MLGNPTVYWNARACLKIHCYNSQTCSRACLKIAFCKIPSQFASDFMLDLGGVVGYIDEIQHRIRCKVGRKIVGMNFQTRSRASLQEYVIGTCQFLAIVRRNCRTASGKWADFQTELGTAFAIFILQISPIQLQLTYTSSWILNVWMVASIFLQSIPANAGAVKGWLQNLLLRAHTYSGIFLPDSADFGSSPPLWDYGRAIGRASCWFYGICAVCCVGKHRIKKTENDFERARPCWATAHRGLFMKPVYRHSTISKETVKIDAAKKLGDVIFNQKKPETPDL